MDDGLLQTLGDRFLDQWLQLGRVTVGEEALWSTLKGARECGDLTDRMNPREFLIRVLEVLAGAGKVVLPTGKSGWDRMALPYVPRWIRLVGQARTESNRDWQAWIWHDLLLPAVANRKSLSSAQKSVLFRLDGVLKNSGPLPRAGMRSRSLHLTGDEKTLDRIMEGAAFRALEPEVLNVVDYPAPLSAVRLGSGPILRKRQTNPTLPIPQRVG